MLYVPCTLKIEYTEAQIRWLSDRGEREATLASAPRPLAIQGRAIQLGHKPAGRRLVRDDPDG